MKFTYNLVVLALLMLSVVSCGKKKKKVYLMLDQNICQNGSSSDPEVVCNPLTSNVIITTGGSNSGSTNGSAGGSTSGSTGGASNGGSTSGSTGSSNGGSNSGGGDGGSVVLVPANGLMANLYEGDSTYKTLDEFSARGIFHEKYVFLTNFDLPARKWDTGFMFGEAEFVKNQKGEKLIEWFSLVAKGYIQLPQYLEDGQYQFIAVSDDGIKVTIDNEVILNKQQPQAPAAVCSTKAVNLSKGSRKSFELKYFQGPRYQIAMSLYLRRLDPNATLYQSKFCGKSTTHANMIEEGWTVVPASYFFLPEEI